MFDVEQCYVCVVEFIWLVYDLWDSFFCEVFLVDCESGCYVDVFWVCLVDYDGEFFKVKGLFNLLVFGEVWIFLVQVGVFESGCDFVVLVVDLVFVLILGKEVVLELCCDFFCCVECYGCLLCDVCLLLGFSLYLVESCEEVWEIFMQIYVCLDCVCKFVMIRQMFGFDFSDWLLDWLIFVVDLLLLVVNFGSCIYIDLLWCLIECEMLCLDQLLLCFEVVFVVYWQVIGMVDDVVEQIVDWVGVGVMDGFIVVLGGLVGLLWLFFEQVVLCLVEKGLFCECYSVIIFVGYLVEE